MSNPEGKRFAIQYRWDTVKLISDSKGDYYFLTSDTRLKECEGSWYIGSNGLEGECTGFIRQKNLSGSIITEPFNIAIKIEGQSYSLPFRRISSDAQ